MSLTVEVDDLPAREYIDSILEMTGDLTPVMRGIGMEMENRVRGRFETQTDQPRI